MTLFITKFKDGGSSATIVRDNNLIVVDEIRAADGVNLPTPHLSENLSDDDKTVYTVNITGDIKPLYTGEKHLHVSIENVEAMKSVADTFGIE